MAAMAVCSGSDGTGIVIFEILLLLMPETFVPTAKK